MHDYAKIGGSSPIWADTEYIAGALRELLKAPVLTFHRYLPATHKLLLEELNTIKCDEIRVFPMFPQFTYATTGSAARFFMKYCSAATLDKLCWVKSYPTHLCFVRALQNSIKKVLHANSLNEHEVFFLFSAHGLPKIFVEKGDIYASECQASFDAVMQGFFSAKGVLCYQSKFGKGEWLRPYTVDVCETIERYCEGRPHCVFVPISFTSDHIETLFEVEEQYMPILSKKEAHPIRVPALNRCEAWIQGIAQILAESPLHSTSELVRIID